MPTGLLPAGLLGLGQGRSLRVVFDSLQDAGRALWLRPGAPEGSGGLGAATGGAALGAALGAAGAAVGGLGFVMHRPPTMGLL